MIGSLLLQILSRRRFVVLFTFFLSLTTTPFPVFGQANDAATPFQPLREGKGVAAHSGYVGPSLIRGKRGALEGHVRDDSGKPVKGVFISLDQGSYTTRGETNIIPIIVPHLVVGAVVVSDPEAVKSHTIEWHHTKTDKNGHFSFKHLIPGRYNFEAGPYKRNFTTGWGELVDNKKLKQEYVFPAKDNMKVAGGEKMQHDIVVLSSTKKLKP